MVSIIPEIEKEDDSNEDEISNKFLNLNSVQDQESTTISSIDLNMIISHVNHHLDSAEKDYFNYLLTEFSSKRNYSEKHGINYRKVRAIHFKIAALVEFYSDEKKPKK